MANNKQRRSDFSNRFNDGDYDQHHNLGAEAFIGGMIASYGEARH